MKRPWFPFYVGDFLADTMTLTDEEVGAYLRLLLAQFRCKCIPFAYANAYAKWDAIAKFFERETIDGVEYVYSARLRAEMERMGEVSKNKSKNAYKRWGKEIEDANAYADAYANDHANVYAKPMLSQSHSQSHKAKKEKVEKEKAEAGTVARPTGGQPAQFSFPLDSGKTWNLKAEDMLALEDAFPEIDVPGEMRKAIAWLTANPARRKTAKGMPRFVNGWLARTADRGQQPKSNGKPETGLERGRPANLEEIFAVIQAEADGEDGQESDAA